MFWYITIKAGAGTPLDRFVGKFNLISALIIPIGIFLTNRIFQLQYQAMNREATFKMIDRGWITLNEKMFLYYKSCPRFVDSLYFDWQKERTNNDIISNNDIIPDNDDWQAVNYLTILIFQAWEDYITSRNVDETYDVAWINCFISWSNSKILKNRWDINKMLYGKFTQEFGDYLFNITSTHMPKNETEMNNLGILIAESETYKNILFNRFNSSSS